MALQIEVAPPKDRFLAAAIDFVPPAVVFLLLAIAGQSGLAAMIALFGSIYFVFRDLLGKGQSFGKRMRSLQVVDTETDRAPAAMPLLLRNLGFGVPGLNVIYAVVEGIRVLQHPQGLRFGDMFGDTGVVKVPPDEREKLLLPKKERPSREGKAVADAPLPEGALEAPDPAVPAAPPVTTPSGSGRVPAAAPVATPSNPSRPAAAAAAAAASAPLKQAPKPIDLPPDTSSPAPKPAAPAAPAPGVAPAADDPLKKLIEQATAKK